MRLPRKIMKSLSLLSVCAVSLVGAVPAAQARSFERKHRVSEPKPAARARVRQEIRHEHREHVRNRQHGRRANTVVVSTPRRFYRRDDISFPEYLARSLLHAGIRYYFHQGGFYRLYPSGYVLVSAPAGAIVPDLPIGYQTIIVHGQTYFIYNDVYYLRQGRNFVVVTPPVITVAPQVTAVQAPVIVTEPQEQFTVSVPNVQGGYTAVTLTRSDGGFIGPQGEFYETFPTVEQLRVMYGT